MLQLTPQDPEALRGGRSDSAARGFQTRPSGGSSAGASATSTTLYTRTRDGFLTYCKPADIPLSAALLAWRLLVARSGEEDGVEALRLGRYVEDWTSHRDSPTTRSDGGAQTFTAQVAKFMVAPGATIQEAHGEAERLVQGTLGRADERVGANSTVYFTDAAQSDSRKGAVSQIAYNVCIKLKTSPGQLVISFEWTNSEITRWWAGRALQAYTRYLTAILSQVILSKPGTSLDGQAGSARLVWDLIGPSNEDLNQIWFWNASMPPTVERCIHDLVSERSISTPDKVAVQAWDGEFTYRELESLSNTIARQLRAQAGVRVGDIVMLVFEKSRWTTPALLGVLKSGAAFVLTDPAQPEARLKTIASQTGAKAVVCSKLQADLARRIAQDGDEECGRQDKKQKQKPKPKPAVVLVASDDTTLQHAGWGVGASAGFLPVVPADSAMYVIFTSGSTGVPKGVVCSHANFVSGAIPRAEAVGYGETSRVFEFASYAFDVSIDCMLCTLMQGGTVCVPSEAGRVDNLGAAILASGANMAHMTPSVARVLEDPETVMRSLDVLGLGGEAVSAGDAAAWSRLTKVVIAYGPSECTVGCTINHEVCADNTTIGKGTGAVTWIVHPDDHNRLMPVGSVGELLIEGPVVGLGYLGQPDKTAEVFVRDPIWLRQGHTGSKGRRGLLYKTGDLVKYDANGYIVFVGRKDQQVKLRGQRIELSEIEHHLRKNLPPCVKIAAEVVRPSGAEPTLVVFVDEQQPMVNGTKTKTKKAKNDKVGVDDVVKLSPELGAIVADMDGLLGEELPRYMVPAAYIPLQSMPVLASAKIDRKRLKALGASMTREQIAKLRLLAPKPARPLSDLERSLASLWASVLGTDVEIGLRDSFFGIGGDSLRAMKLVSAARGEGIALTVAQVFDNHTLVDMAAVAVVDGDLGSSEPQNIAPFSLIEKTWTPEEARRAASKYCSVKESAVEDVYPCTPLQEGLMALSAKFPDSYVAQRVLRLADMAEARRLQGAFETAARESAILRTRIIQVPGHGLQQVVVQGPIEWRSGATVEAYLEADRDEPMDLGKPLVRYGLVQSADQVDFVLTMHHALYDGWAMPLVIDRVNRAYDGLATERPAEFKHFIRFLSEVDQSACEAYWRQQLEGATAVQFPALPHEGYMTQADSLLEMTVPAPPRSSGSATTTATIVRGAWALVAATFAGHDDVVFGETLTGRNAPVAGADLIEGPMITTVPIRVAVDRQCRVAEFLARIQDQTVRQIPFEHTGLQHIRRVSPDAMEACELRTGLVLHPAGADHPFDPAYPASRLVPANDAEAAREALKFNTYALMLVCALAPDGYHVMASFDSRAVDVPTMQRVLQMLRDVTALLCEGLVDDRVSVGDVVRSVTAGSPAAVETLAELDLLGRGAVGSVDVGARVDRVWLVDPDTNQLLVPRGAVGEIVVDSPSALSLPAIDVPAWHIQVPAVDGEGAVHLHATGQLAKFDQQGKLVHMGRKGERVLPPRPVKDRPAGVQKGSEQLSAKEVRLRNLWAQILYLEADGIGADDSFFKLGGDSIGAMKLVSEARPAGFKISVAQIFKTKTLAAMAEMAEDISMTANEAQGEGSGINEPVATPFSLIEDVGDVDTFVDQQIKPKLSKPWKVSDAYPTRPLQTVAVTGSTQTPRFSMRYEAMYFDDHRGLDVARLQQVCREVVQRNEILRTVFATAQNKVCYGVVLDDMAAEFDHHDVAPGTDVQKFTHQLCNRDIEGDIPEGAAFVKWHLVRAQPSATSAPGALVLRISHAQYDEICLPLILRQIEALYTGQAAAAETIPFSRFVHHTLRTANPRSVGYWRELLAGSAPPTVLRPDLGAMTQVPAAGRRHYAVDRTLDISAAAGTAAGITVATIPTAAWALCLARRRGLADVLFGEVVSGRGTGFAAAERVVGPCWQYVPFRARFAPGVTTGADLLEAVQEQHAASSAHEGLALAEITRLCCPGWPAVDWFDTVVHQDVEHVEDLGFRGLGATTETIYPHQEPLREWKCQAFVADGGKKLTVEIVTFEAWREQADEVLAEVAACVEELVCRPGDVLRL
ncbi:NRPS [Pyricularia oryzae]|nr:NRPS [Pyricularia oryzae]